MTTTFVHPENRTESPQTPVRVSTGGAALLDLAGVAGIVLGILGLANIVPVSLDGIAILVLGGALALGGGLFAGAFREMRHAPMDDRRSATGGFTAEVLLGLAGAVLGILALANVSSINLIAIGVIALGVALWVGSATEARLHQSLPRAGRSVRQSMAGGAGLDVVLGIIAVGLGIAALAGAVPRVLTLIAVIGIGVALLVTGSVTARRMARAPRAA